MLLKPGFIRYGTHSYGLGTWIRKKTPLSIILAHL